MSWKTQKKGQNVTVHERVEVIWLTDRRLYSRDGTTRTVSKVRDSVKITEPAPVIGEVLPLAVQIID